MSVTHNTVGSIRKLVVELTADAAGSFAPVTLPTFQGTLLAVRSGADPWAGVAPTAGWSVEVFDQNGLDVLEGCGLNRSASTSQGSVIRYSGKNLHPVVSELDALTLKITGNHVPFAVIPLTILYGLGYVHG